MAAKARILVVEDEGIVAMDIQRSLESLGYPDPEVASSGEEAVEKAAEFRPDLVLMDIRLGDGIDGVEAALAIGDSGDIPVIFLTAYTDEETLERAKLSQPFGYLVKPFSPKELQTSIEMAMYKHAMEQQLKEREQWLTATLRSIGDGVVATRPDGKILFMNPKAEDMTGWDESDALDRELEKVFPLLDHRGDSLPVHPGRRALDLGLPVTYSGEVSLRARDGSTLPVDETSAPIRGFRGGMGGMVLVFKDATRRREAEDRRMRAEELLKQAQKLDAMGRFAGGLAHDFNNHLSVIMGMSEILAAEFHDDPENGRLVDEIRKACSNSVGLTRQLQAYSRRDSVKLGAVDLNLALLEAETALRRNLDAGINLRIQSVPLAPIRSDAASLEQAILSLAHYAKENMPRGGDLTLETSLEILTGGEEGFVFPVEPGSYGSLRVTDTGRGIAGEALPFLFEPFYKTKDHPRGTGLGLAIVHGMMKHAGGNIKVRSKPGEGASISLFFPFAALPAGIPHSLPA